jgi:hypothetical protein
MCKTNVEINIYYVNIYKYEHEKNMTRLWCEVVPKTNVKYIKGIKGPTFIYIPLGT